MRKILETKVREYFYRLYMSSLLGMLKKVIYNFQSSGILLILKKIRSKDFFLSKE